MREQITLSDATNFEAGDRIVVSRWFPRPHPASIVTKVDRERGVITIEPVRPTAWGWVKVYARWAVDVVLWAAWRLRRIARRAR